MTVASEITRLQDAKSCIRNSIQNKGVTVWPSLTIDQYPACIDKIKTTDYSVGTIAYWLKATRSMNGTRSSWLWTMYSEISDDWVVSSLFYNDWWLLSSNCDVRGVDFLVKCPWCNPTWTSIWVHNVGDSRSTSWLRIYWSDTDNSCFLVKRIYCCVGYMSSWSCWNDTCYYDTIWVNRDCHCARCIGSWTWCTTWACCGSKNCDNNPPGEWYTYLGTSANVMCCCRQRPAGILCTTLESQCDGNYIGAAVFR